MNYVDASRELGRLRDPANDALEAFVDLAGGDIEIDTAAATKLEVVDGKATMGRASAPVYHLGRFAGTMWVLAFQAGGGTGDRSLYEPDDVFYGRYVGWKDDGVLPRAKDAAHSEVELALVTRVDGQDLMFAGNKDLVGIKDGELVKLADLGQGADEFDAILCGDADAAPTATLTVGYHVVPNPDGVNARYMRFGGAHAVVNPHSDLEGVQVSAFWLISPGDVRNHFGALSLLGARVPILIDSRS
jgi:hypothetical protein